MVTGSEDFAFFAELIPGLQFTLGVTPRDADPDTVAVNHSPHFYANERALVIGFRAFAKLAVDHLWNSALRNDRGAIYGCTQQGDRGLDTALHVIAAARTRLSLVSEGDAAAAQVVG